MIEEGKEIEIIFVSSDGDESSFTEYYGSMPWVSLPFSNRAAKDNLSAMFGVRGIPTMIVLDGTTGKVVDRDGRTTVVTARGNTNSVWSKWSN